MGYFTDWPYLGGSDGKESACNAGDPGSIHGSGRSPGEGNGNPVQYSCLENSMDRGAWQATVHWVTESDTIEQVAHYLFETNFSPLYQIDSKSELHHTIPLPQTLIVFMFRCLNIGFLLCWKVLFLSLLKSIHLSVLLPDTSPFCGLPFPLFLSQCSWDVCGFVRLYAHKGRHCIASPA